MELLQVLHKDIPTKDNIFSLFNKKQSQDISKKLLQMIKRVKRGMNNKKIFNAFCMELYDILSYYVMFDKIKIAKKILRLLEELALPIQCIGENRRNESCKKITKIKL